MKYRKNQANLKQSIVLFFVCILISGAFMGTAHYFNSTLEKSFNMSKHQLSSISRRYIDFDQEKELLRDYYPQFISLNQQGIVGNERRLNWIEVLRDSGERIKLPDLNYSISSQEPHKPEFIADLGGYTIYRSSMELNLGLLHEGDFFRLLDDLDHHAEGSYALSKCTFSMTANEIVFKKKHANIVASCLLDWFTINPDNWGGNI